MKIGFVGLGKMGGNMALRLTLGSPDGKTPGGHQVVGYAKDPNPTLEGVQGITLVPTLEQLVSHLAPPRVVWVMVPAGQPTESVVSDLADLMSPGDILIDGGNSYYKDSVRRAQGLEARKIAFIDVGTSGGIWGRQEGYCMMVGGDERPIDACRPIFDTLAPTDGWARVGPSGAGHFTKMVHNGIEYGLMEAYGEGFDVLHKSEFKPDLAKVAMVWNHGSVIRSWLLELAERALAGDRELASVAPYVEDSGEGRWTIMAALEESVAVPVISSALFSRFESRDPYDFSSRFAAALRHQFGGHGIRKTLLPELEASGQTHPPRP